MALAMKMEDPNNVLAQKQSVADVLAIRLTLGSRFMKHMLSELTVQINMSYEIEALKP